VLAILFGVLIAIGAASPDPPLRGIYAGNGPEFLAVLDFNQSPALLRVWGEATVGGPLHTIVFSLQQVGPERYALMHDASSCGDATIHLAPTGLVTMTSAAGILRFAVTGDDIVRVGVAQLHKDVAQMQQLRHDTGETDEVFEWPIPKCSKP
jgi:hypothetical protein